MAYMLYYKHTAKTYRPTVYVTSGGEDTEEVKC